MTPARWLVAGVAALVLLAGCSQAGARSAGPAPAATSSTADQAASGVEAARGFHSVRDYRATPEPVRIDIPRIGVSSSLVRLGRAPDGTVEVPKSFRVAGWYVPGTRPGDPGSAVILGHVDSKRGGPAVFYRLRELHRGDEIRVKRADGCPGYGSWPSGPSSSTSSGSRPTRSTTPPGPPGCGW
jgi:Sortase domain